MDNGLGTLRKSSYLGDNWTQLTSFECEMNT